MICPLVQKDGKPSPCLRERCAWWMKVKDGPLTVSACAVPVAAFSGLQEEFTAAVNGKEEHYAG